MIRLVCKACGTQHKILVTHEFRGEKYIIHCQVKIVTVPSRARIGTMMARRKRLELGALRAKFWLDGLPLVFAEYVFKEEALRLAQPLEEAGVRVVIEECSREPNPYHYGEPFRTDALTAANGPCHAELDEYELHPAVNKGVPGPRVGPRGNIDLERQVGNLAFRRAHILPCHDWAGEVPCKNRCREGGIDELRQSHSLDGTDQRARRDASPCIGRGPAPLEVCPRFCVDGGGRG